MTEKRVRNMTKIEKPKVYEAYICDLGGEYKLREFFWTEKSARKCIEEALEDVYEYDPWEHEYGVRELDIQK